MPRSPQGTGPQRFGRSDARWSPANDWRGGRVVGDGYRVQAQNGHGQSSNPQMRRLASEVDGAPGAASDAMTATTSHTTPDTRLIASSGAAEGEPRSSGKARVCSKSLPLASEGVAQSRLTAGQPRSDLV